MTKVLLYSGGMDSWLIDKLWKPDVRLYINIHGSYSDEEIKRLPKDVKVIDLPIGIYEQENKYVPLRNLYFLMIASNYGDELCYGAVAGDWRQRDKTPEFVKMAEDMLNYLLGPQSKVDTPRHIHIETKFLYMHKNEILAEYIKQGGSLKALYEDSFSCFTPIDGKPCLSCKPCFRKYICMASLGYEFSKEERKKMYDFVRKEIVPRSANHNATYYSERGEEGKAAKSVVLKLYEEFGGNINEDEKM